MAIKLAVRILEGESELMKVLASMDEERAYAYFGYKSLRGYCVHCLGFSRTQAQRITTCVRRIGTTFNIGIEDTSGYGLTETAKATITKHSPDF